MEDNSSISSNRKFKNIENNKESIIEERLLITFQI